ncbi:hypothetical protein A7P53_01230 [Acinetobacter defluvii]|uniref:GGDEF domain-containing protein n=1 Tax=Acinetobacter defluvii TaxID=1871111 RepID=UPI00148FC744|nr:GGDEF domain-containing protein [Acinetobacter defluvii]NNP73987.1 hypothetical protein [Acinetobacter defluvii]
MSVFYLFNTWCKKKSGQLFQNYIHLLELNNIEKSRVVTGLLFFFHLFFLLSLLPNLQHPFLNAAALPWAVGLLLVYMGSAALLYFISFFIPSTEKTNRYFPIICLALYSSSLMSIGAFTGMMTSITGVFTIGSILTGLLIFERHAIFWGSIPCLIVFYAISLLNIFQILPYALIFHPYTMVTEQSQNFMIILNLIISTVVGVTIIRVFYAFLNRWKAREQKQRVLMSLDPLTQILNRRGLSDHYESIQQHAEIQNHPLCVALLDIDYFKKVNDQHGHDAGDQVLQKIAQILKLNLREYDHIGRFGGEEFMIIFTNTSSNMAFSILERCRKSIEHHELAYQGQIIRFTASFGLSCSELYGYDQQTLLQKADLALYEAKKSGRNCIRMAKEIT